jgi:hypothetical protein
MSAKLFGSLGLAATFLAAQANEQPMDLIGNANRC